MFQWWLLNLVIAMVISVLTGGVVAHAQQLPAGPTCEQQLATRIEQAQTLTEAWAQAQSGLRLRWAAQEEEWRAKQKADAATIAELRKELVALKGSAEAPTKPEK